jgi:hypothetical protein
MAKMVYDIDEILQLDDDLNDTASFLNTELDYHLCGHYGITIDELDIIPMAKLRELRIYALFGNYEALDEQSTDLELWLEENFPYKDIIPFHNQSKGE